MQLGSWKSLPSGVTPVSVTASQGSCVNNSGTINCTLGDLANAARATVTLVVTPTIARTLALREQPGQSALETVIEHLLSARHEVSELCEGERPREAYATLTDAEEIRSSYTALMERDGRWTVSGAGTRGPSWALGRDSEDLDGEDGRRPDGAG